MRDRTRLKLWSNITMTAAAIVAATAYLRLFGRLDVKIMAKAYGPLIFCLLAIHCALERKILMASGENVLGARVLRLLTYSSVTLGLGVFCISFFL
jgi:hypothetical protein